MILFFLLIQLTCCHFVQKFLFRDIPNINIDIQQSAQNYQFQEFTFDYEADLSRFENDYKKIFDSNNLKYEPDFFTSISGDTYCKYCHKNFIKNFYQRYHNIVTHFDHTQNHYFLELDKELKKLRDIGVSENYLTLTIMKYMENNDSFSHKFLIDKLQISQKIYQLWKLNSISDIMKAFYYVIFSMIFIFIFIFFVLEIIEFYDPYYDQRR